MDSSGLHTAERIPTAPKMRWMTSKLKSNHLDVELSIECDKRKIATKKCVLCDVDRTSDIRDPVNFEKYFT